MIPDRVRRTADRLAAGSDVVRRRRGAGLASWVRRARRTDLTGLPAALGPMLRLALLAAAGLALYGMLRAAPWLMWPLTGVWCWRALRAAPEEQPARDPSASHADAVYDAVLHWLWDMVGDRQGVHLRDLLTTAHAHGMFEGCDLPTLRARLEEAGIPVRKRVRVRGKGVTVGVHRDDLETRPAAPSGAPSPVDGQDPPTPRLHVV